MENCRAIEKSGLIRQVSKRTFHSTGLADPRKQTRNNVKTLLLIAALAVSLSAHATPGNNGEGNGGCGVGQQTNGCGSTGGAGGNGGAGGSVVGSGNSSNVNQQGQSQAQFQG